MVPDLQRVVINVGHGLNNARVGALDLGALACPNAFGGTNEYALVVNVADDLQEQPSLPVPLIRTPECSPSCVRLHSTKFERAAGHAVPVSHLSYTIDWINDHAAQGDYVLSLHMDAADDDDPDPSAPTGVSVYFSSGAPAQRRLDAIRVGRAVASKLGIPFRGAFPDTVSHRQHLGILDDTKPPALLLELGFVTNPTNVDAVKTCGGEAVAEGIKALYDSWDGQ